MVADVNKPDSRTMLPSTKPKRHFDVKTHAREDLSLNKNKNDCFQYIRKTLRKQGLSADATEIIIKSWRDSTRKQYNTYIEQWIHYSKGKTNPFKPDIQTIVQFLTHLYTRGLSYTAINTARSAISSFVKITGQVDIHSDGLISRLLKGVFSTRPSIKKSSIWDAKVVLRYLEQIDTSSLLMLTCKLCMLFLLVTAQRCQTLHVLKLSDVHVHKDKVVINVSSIIKQTRPGVHQRPIVLHSFRPNTKLCIVEIIREYLDRTQFLRNSDSLLIATVKPHKSVSKQSVARWVKLVMKNAGIADVYTPHSTRSATCSSAFQNGVSLLEITKTAGWSNAKTFARYYNKPLDTDANEVQANILNT